MDNLDLLIFALVLDALFGEPAWLWMHLPHPATLMGRAVDWLDLRLNRGEHRRFAGGVAIISLVLVTLLAGVAISLLPDAGVFEVLGAAILLAQRSLCDHVSAVATGLRENLENGRKAVAMIVGRDSGDLDESSITRSAIESAAENFSDAVIAPAFWFLLFGLPGIMVYKIVNTADSMIGYRTDRYRDFGWASARLDDALNWIPARITGALICLAHWSMDALRVMQKDAHKHRSPNAGWPESAMAGVLHIALAGPRSYDGKMINFAWVNGSARKSLGPKDIDNAVKALWYSWATALVICIAATLVI
ncbi:MAG: adenosylcobinamide-phosphate synthase CbiB [Paracoccaceae bacterium]